MRKTLQSSYSSNFWKERVISDDSMLVTVDSGEWCILSNDEYLQLRNGGIQGDDLMLRLKDSHILLDEKGRGEFLEIMRKRYVDVLTRPILHIVVLTPQCNLRCIYCQAALNQGTQGAMTIEIARKTLSHIINFSGDSYTLELQGGEPSLNFDVIKYLVSENKRLTELHNKRYSVAIVTNFTDVLTEEKMRFLIENDVDISTSLDGPKSVHEDNRNRNYPGGFEVFASKVKLYNRLFEEIKGTQPKLGAMVTATRAVLDKPRETIDTYINLGIYSMFIRPVNPIGRGAVMRPELDYDIEDFLIYWEGIVDYIVELWDSGIQIDEGYLTLLLRKIFHRDNNYMDLRSPCGAAFGQRTYNFDGRIYTCDEGRMVESQDFCLGSVDNSIEEINDSFNGLKTFEASLSELSYCEFCAYKPFCGTCPLLNWKATGNPTTSIWNSRRCKLLRGMLDIVFRKFLTDEHARRVFGEMVVNSI
jgi:His-Xaa-Ser system radical SAM maturase HxsB